MAKPYFRLCMLFATAVSCALACSDARRQREPQTINVPNWASTGHVIVVVFSDFPQG